MKTRPVLYYTALAVCAGALVLWPDKALTAARQGLVLCGGRVIPALFPFFVLSALAVDLGAAGALGRLLRGWMAPLFRLPGVCAGAWVLGLIGGYPVGARTVAELYRRGELSARDARRALPLCNSCGPAFLLGVVGAGVFGDRRAGVLLWLTHVAGGVLTGSLLRGQGPRSRGDPGPVSSPAPAPSPGSGVFTDAVRGACTSVLNVSAFVVLFTVVLGLLPLEGLPPWPRVLLTGFLEVTSGVCALNFGSARLRLTAAALLLGWGGLCVHCQTAALLGDLSPRPYLRGKALHGLLAAGLTWLAAPLVPLSVTAGAFPLLPVGAVGVWWLPWAVVLALKIWVETGRKVW